MSTSKIAGYLFDKIISLNKKNYLYSYNLNAQRNHYQSFGWEDWQAS